MNTMYKDQIDKARIPSHVAIIMDGNGRWAKQHGKARTFGHQAGAETAHQIIEEAARLGIKYLTLYTFSIENWKRPLDEVTALMTLLMDSIEEESFMANNIRFCIIGDLSQLSENIQIRLNDCIAYGKQYGFMFSFSLKLLIEMGNNRSCQKYCIPSSQPAINNQ